MKLLMRSLMHLVAGFCILIFGVTSFAQTFVGTILAVQGDVKVLHVPTPQDHRPFARLKGQEYAYVQAKLGMKVNPGEVILSETNGKIKIVYPNGDTFLIGNSSSFILPTMIDKQADNSKVNDGATSTVKMYYGRFRATISKTGPRNSLRVVTPDAVAGVRGTDFFTRANATYGTQLTVLRGTVAMRSEQDLSHAIDVHSGYSAATSVKLQTFPHAEEATREDIMYAQKSTAVKPNPHAIAHLPSAERQEIHHLQKKEFESVMADIHDHNPGLYRELQKRGVRNIEQINRQVIQRLAQNAPAKKKKKPTRDELNRAGRNTYKRYYRHHGK